MILLIPGIILSLWAQFKVKHTYAKYAEIATRSGLTGAEVAQLIMRNAEVRTAEGARTMAYGINCPIQAVPGELTDHYDPRERVLRLSEGVYHGRSIAALGVAAHEVGHAIQHANLYSFLMWRNAIYPMVSISSTLSWPLLLGGLIFGMTPLLKIGILLFSLAVLFTLITLPVEFDASKRAIRALASGGYLTDDELYGAKKVLSAAALTYVAAAAMALLQLLRLILIARGRD
ncbi:MAG: zinc metallopeptidase [Candidatus Hydrogenedentes bacterium]|nr:zinc metallopeptidase [Candidatus Hydrogenedentota bacterium]